MNFLNLFVLVPAVTVIAVLMTNAGLYALGMIMGPVLTTFMRDKFRKLRSCFMIITLLTTIRWRLQLQSHLPRARVSIFTAI